MNDTTRLELAERDLERAQDNMRIAEEQYPHDSKEYESVCEEMQGALTSYDEAIKQTM